MNLSHNSVSRISWHSISNDEGKQILEAMFKCGGFNSSWTTNKVVKMDRPKIGSKDHGRCVILQMSYRLCWSLPNLVQNYHGHTTCRTLRSSANITDRTAKASYNATKRSMTSDITYFQWAMLVFGRVTLWINECIGKQRHHNMIQVLGWLFKQLGKHTRETSPGTESLRKVYGSRKQFWSNGNILQQLGIPEILRLFDLPKMVGSAKAIKHKLSKLWSIFNSSILSLEEPGIQSPISSSCITMAPSSKTRVTFSTSIKNASCPTISTNDIHISISL